MKLATTATLLAIVFVSTVFARVFPQRGTTKVIKLDGREARAVATALHAVLRNIQGKKADVSAYEIKIESYPKEKVVQFLATGSKMDEYPSYAVVCTSDGTKVKRVVLQQ